MVYKFPKDHMREVIDLDAGEEFEKYKVIEVGDWDEDGSGKYSYRETIFTCVDYPDKFFSLTISRTGSYYSDWYYDYEDWGDEVEAYEVKKVEVIKYEWRVVK